MDLALAVRCLQEILPSWGGQDTCTSRSQRHDWWLRCDRNWACGGEVRGQDVNWLGAAGSAGMKLGAVRMAGRNPIKQRFPGHPPVRDRRTTRRLRCSRKWSLGASQVFCLESDWL